MGRVRLMRTLESDGLAPEQMAKLETCLGCYSCETVCPSKVNFGKMLDESLAKLNKQRPLPLITRMMLWLTSRITVIKNIVKLTYLSQRLGLRTLFAKLGLLKVVGLQRANALLGNVKYPAQLINGIIQQQSNEQRVALFTGCFSSVMEQDIQQATIDVFNKLGIEVVIPVGQGCCGAMHRHNGELETAATMARNNIKVFFTKKVDAIISTSSACGASLKKYDEWLNDEVLTTPVMDVSHYLADVLKQHELEFKQMPIKVALHTPCTLRQNEDQEEAVMELLQKIPGLELVPLSGEPRCCGAGGSQVLSHSEMADALRDDVINEIKEIDPDVLISSNLGCVMHLRQGLVEVEMDIPLQHPVQLVSQAVV